MHPLDVNYYLSCVHAARQVVAGRKLTCIIGEDDLNKESPSGISEPGNGRAVRKLGAALDNNKDPSPSTKAFCTLPSSSQEAWNQALDDLNSFPSGENPKPEVSGFVHPDTSSSITSSETSGFTPREDISPSTSQDSEAPSLSEGQDHEATRLSTRRKRSLRLSTAQDQHTISPSTGRGDLKMGTAPSKYAPSQPLGARGSFYHRRFCVYKLTCPFQNSSGSVTRSFPRVAQSINKPASRIGTLGYRSASRDGARIHRSSSFKCGWRRWYTCLRFVPLQIWRDSRN